VKQNATFDASFWSNVHRAGLVDALLARYRLHYTPAMARELREEFPSGRAFWARVRGGELAERTPGVEAVRELGAGERAAINLAVQHPEWVLLLDDQRPFRAAAGRGLRVICSPVLVVALYEEGSLDAVGTLAALARLAALGTLSPHLLAAALAQLGAIFTAKEGD
jgi:predicted nucleic acid-binding protein